jgi:lysyl-tRNA synthetase class II
MTNRQINIITSEETVHEYTQGELDSFDNSHDASHNKARMSRLMAFREESDVLFFKVQRGEAELSEYFDKVAEIRARYPYPENGSVE